MSRRDTQYHTPGCAASRSSSTGCAACILMDWRDGEQGGMLKLNQAPKAPLHLAGSGPWSHLPVTPDGRKAWPLCGNQSPRKPLSYHPCHASERCRSNDRGFAQAVEVSNTPIPPPLCVRAAPCAPWRCWPPRGPFRSPRWHTPGSHPEEGLMQRAQPQTQK